MVRRGGGSFRPASSFFSDAMPKTLADWLRLAGCVVLCNAAGALGALTTVTGGGTWYASLTRPPLSPPSWVFGPVWTLLYTLMGIALWLLWQRWHGPARRRKRALGLFAVQLALNAIWTPVFFGAQALGIALAVIVSMLAAIAATMVAASPVCAAVPWLLLPYLLWVSFATYLNAAFWLLNR